MTSLGFENYSEALKIYLTKYREVRTHTRISLHPSLPSPQQIDLGADKT